MVDPILQIEYPEKWMFSKKSASLNNQTIWSTISIGWNSVWVAQYSRGNRAVVDSLFQTSYVITGQLTIVLQWTTG